MATTMTLRTKFKDAGGDNMTINFPYADEDTEDADVKALMNGIITNKALWQKQPTEKVSAEMISTTTVEFDISD